MKPVTPGERAILAHSLGLTNSDKTYRNHFHAEPEHSDMPLLLSLIDKGLMYKNPRVPNYYHVSDAGKDFMDDTARRMTVTITQICFYTAPAPNWSFCVTINGLKEYLSFSAKHEAVIERAKWLREFDGVIQEENQI